MGDKEPKLSISCNKERLPVELGQQPSTKTCKLKFALPERYSRVKLVENLWEWPINDWSCYDLECPEDSEGPYQAKQFLLRCIARGKGKGGDRKRRDGREKESQGCSPYIYGW